MKEFKVHLYPVIRVGIVVKAKDPAQAMIKAMKAWDGSPFDRGLSVNQKGQESEHSGDYHEKGVIHIFPWTGDRKDTIDLDHITNEEELDPKDREALKLWRKNHVNQ